MPPKRARAASSTSEDVPVESPLAQLNAGRDPEVWNAQGKHTLRRLSSSELESAECDDAEKRAYLLSGADLIAAFFPGNSVKRERNLSLLISWDIMKTLPPDWYAIVFELSATPGRFRAVPEHKLMLDAYPSGGGDAKDPEKLAGFGKREHLRLVLYPNALRFLWVRMHEPLCRAGVWPTARAVMMYGYILAAAAQEDLADAIDSVGSGPWLPAFRSALRQRYWGAEIVPVSTAEPPPPPPPPPPPLPQQQQQQSAEESLEAGDDEISAEELARERHVEQEQRRVDELGAHGRLLYDLGSILALRSGPALNENLYPDGPPRPSPPLPPLPLPTPPVGIVPGRTRGFWKIDRAHAAHCGCRYVDFRSGGAVLGRSIYPDRWDGRMLDAVAGQPGCGQPPAKPTDWPYSDPARPARRFISRYALQAIDK